MKKRDVMSDVGDGLLFISMVLCIVAINCDNDSVMTFYILFFLALFCGVAGGVLLLYCHFVWDKTIKEVNNYYDTYESWYSNDNIIGKSQVMTNLLPLRTNVKTVIKNVKKYNIKVMPNSKIIQNTAYLNQLCMQGVLTNNWYENHELYSQVNQSLKILNDEWYMLANDVNKKSGILQKGNDVLNLQKGNVDELSNDAKAGYYIKLGKQIHK